MYPRAVRPLATVGLLLALPVLLPVAQADPVQTPPVTVPGETVPGCLLFVTSRVHVFCGSGTNALCVEDVGCEGPVANAACVAATRAVVCVPRQTVPPTVVPSQTVPTCFVYNSQAVLNGCVDVGSRNETVPSAALGSQVVCIIGNQCVTAPTLVMGTQTVAVPNVTAYAEVTALCPLMLPCRVEP